MTAKDKAKELVEKMLGDNNHYLNQNIEIDKLIAKQSALICVDEMLGIYDIEGYDGDDIEMAYLEEVKQEINKI
jgi:hypothetical protein